MKVILALGNPGAQYTNTRHNVGWTALDTYAASIGVHFSPEKKFTAEIAATTIDAERILLVKPLTFYNEAGRTARALIDFYKLNPATDFLVIHDDLSLPFGTIRTRNKGSDAGNNGIKSLNAHIGPDYWRIRVGVWDEKRDMQHDADFVLSRLSANAALHLQQKITPIITEMIVKFYDEALTATSYRVGIQD